MLSVKTNKEVSDFKRDFMGGFGLKESAAIISGVFIGTIIMVAMILFTSIPMMFAPYIAMPFIGVPVLFSFYHKDGMGVIAHSKKVKEFKKGSACIYASTETAQNYNKCLIEKEKELENNSDDKFKKTLKKLIIIGIITAIIFVGAIVTLLIIKFK